MKTIQKITKIKPINFRKKRVAAYARVSMETERLSHSFAAQMNHYAELIKHQPQWEFVNVFSDYGISGTSTKNRSGFQEMIKQCEEGKIDIILTKSIKRFARNTVDLLNTVRYLKELNVEVRFETENISTFSGEGELMITVLASIAQEESRSISQNVKWGTVKRFKQGIPNGQFELYGYRWNNDQLEIVDEEAVVVKRIFNDFIAGKTMSKIAAELNAEGIHPRKSNAWTPLKIYRRIKNIHYTGNLMLQKYFVTDPINGYEKRNDGELPKYFVEDNHEPIISMETFEKAQAAIKPINRMLHRSEIQILSGKIICGDCGHKFSRATSHDSHYWFCDNHSQTKTKCSSVYLNELVLKRILISALDMETFNVGIISIKLDHITVYGKSKILIHLKDGSIIEKPYERLTPYGQLSDEVREQRNKKLLNKHQVRRKKAVTPFTGLVECEKCGSNYQAHPYKLNSGKLIYYLRCHGENGACPKCAIRSDVLEEITNEVLGIDEMDEAILDANIKRIYVSSNSIRFAFFDGHEEIRQYERKRRK